MVSRTVSGWHSTFLMILSLIDPDSAPTAAQVIAELRTLAGGSERTPR